MPLYTLWDTGTRVEIAFAAIHCTGGDIMIASLTLLVALLLFGNNHWPRQSFLTVALAMIVFGIGYTIFSEWLNIVIRKSWAYNDAMPVVPIIDVGLTPLLQWIVIPTVAMWWGSRSLVTRHAPTALFANEIPKEPIDQFGSISLPPEGDEYNNEIDVKK